MRRVSGCDYPALPSVQLHYRRKTTATDPNDATMRMWCVGVSFEVVCVCATDQAEEDEGTHDAPPRQRPLLWLGHVRAADEDEDEDEEPYDRGEKRLRFVYCSFLA